MEFHLLYFPPNDVWSNGGWSLYKISGDEIAARIKKDAKGQIVERHPWCGFIGCFATLAEANKATMQHLKK